MNLLLHLSKVVRIVLGARRSIGGSAQRSGKIGDFVCPPRSLVVDPQRACVDLEAVNASKLCVVKSLTMAGN